VTDVVQYLVKSCVRAEIKASPAHIVIGLNTAICTGIT